jgi:hypothetical protein
MTIAKPTGGAFSIRQLGSQLPFAALAHRKHWVAAHCGPSFPPQRRSGPSPLYRISAMRLMSAITIEAKKPSTID